MNNLSEIPYQSESKGHQVFFLLLESCWVLFYPYLSNDDIGKIDSALTEKSLRELYIKQVSKFYLTNNIYSVGELEWIMKRGIDLTICRLEFGYEEKLGIFIIIIYMPNFNCLIYSLF